MIIFCHWNFRELINTFQGQIVSRQTLANEEMISGCATIFTPVFTLFVFAYSNTIRGHSLGKVNFYLKHIGQEEIVSCSSDYSTRWLAMK
jgi:hypothetical protein